MGNARFKISNPALYLRPGSKSQWMREARFPGPGNANGDTVSYVIAEPRPVQFRRPGAKVVLVPPGSRRISEEKITSYLFGGDQLLIDLPGIPIASESQS